MDDESDNVEQYKVKAKTPCCYAKDLCTAGKVEDHTPKDHIDECVSPQWGEQYKYEPGGVSSDAVDILDADDAEYVCGSLPEAAHDDDPRVAFAINDSLPEMDKRCEAEEDGEEICWAKCRAKSRPFGLGVILCWTVRGAHFYRRVEVVVFNNNVTAPRFLWDARTRMEIEQLGGCVREGLGKQDEEAGVVFGCVKTAHRRQTRQLYMKQIRRSPI